MSKDSLFKKQNASRPKIDDAIIEILAGNELKNAQDFLAFIKENKMTPSWASANSWKVSYKSKGVCYIRLMGTQFYDIEDNALHIAVFTQFDEHLKELMNNEADTISAIVQRHRDENKPCGGCMPPTLDRHTVNKEYKNICACTCINLNNPNESLHDFAKKLVMLRREAIFAERVPKCRYVKSADRT